MPESYNTLDKMLDQSWESRGSTLDNMLDRSWDRESRIDRETGLPSRALNEAMTGFGDAALMAQTASVLAGGDPSGVAARFKERNARKVSPGMMALSEADTWGETFRAIGENPSVLVEQTARSLASALPTSIAGGALGAAGGAAAGSAVPVVGNVAGGIIGGAVGAGSGSAALSGALKFWERLAALGVDTTDAQAIEKARGGPEWRQALSEAQRYGLTVGAVDAASAGAAGKIAGVARGLVPVAEGAGVARRLASSAVAQGVNATAQGAMGAAGEVAGSTAAGLPVNPADVVGEFFGELAAAPMELASLQNAAALGRRMTGEKSRPAMKAAEAQQVADDVVQGASVAEQAIRDKAQADIDAITRANVNAGMTEEAAKERATQIVGQKVQQAQAQQAAEAEAIQQQAREALAEAQAAGTEAGSQGLDADDLTGIDPTLARVYMDAYRRARRAWERSGGRQSPPTVEAQPEPASITTDVSAPEPMPTVAMAGMLDAPEGASVLDPSAGRDRVVVVPPFDQDVMQHLRKAWGATNPGGRMVALVPLNELRRIGSELPIARRKIVSAREMGPGQDAGAIIVLNKPGAAPTATPEPRSQPKIEDSGVSRRNAATVEAAPATPDVAAATPRVAGPRTTAAEVTKSLQRVANAQGKVYARKMAQQWPRLASRAGIRDELHEYRSAGYVTRSDEGRYLLHPVAGTDSREWRLVDPIDITDQYEPPVPQTPAKRPTDARQGPAERPTPVEPVSGDEAGKRMMERGRKLQTRLEAQFGKDVKITVGWSSVHGVMVQAPATLDAPAGWRKLEASGQRAKWATPETDEINASARAETAPLELPTLDKSPTHRQVADQIRGMVGDDTLRPAAAELLAEVAAQLPPARLRKMKLTSGQVPKDRVGMVERMKSHAKIVLQRGLGSMSAAADPDVTDAAVALEEMAHALWFDLPAADRALVQSVYDDLGEEGRARFFAAGLPDTEPGVKYAGKDVAEFFAHAFSEWVIARRVPEARLVEIFKRLGERMLAAMRRVIARDQVPEHRAVLDRLEPALKQAIGEGSAQRTKARQVNLRPVLPRAQSVAAWTRVVMTYADDMQITPDFEARAYALEDNRVENPNYVFKSDYMYREAKELAQRLAPSRAYLVRKATKADGSRARGADFYLENTEDDWIAGLIGGRSVGKVLAPRVSAEAQDFQTVMAALLLQETKRPRVAVQTSQLRPGDELRIGRTTMVVHRDGRGDLFVKMDRRQSPVYIGDAKEVLVDRDGFTAGPEDNAAFIEPPIEEPQRPQQAASTQAETALADDFDDPFARSPAVQPDDDIPFSRGIEGQGGLFSGGGRPSMPESQGTFAFGSPKPQPQAAQAVALDAVPNTPEMRQFAGVRVGAVLQFNPPKGQELTVVSIRNDPERGVLLTTARLGTKAKNNTPSTTRVVDIIQQFGDTMQVMKRGGAIASTESAVDADAAMRGMWDQAEKDRETGRLFSRGTGAGNDPAMTPQERAFELGKANTRGAYAPSKSERNTLLQQAGLDRTMPGVVEAFMRGYEQSPNRLEYLRKEKAKREAEEAAYAKEFDPANDEDHMEFAESVDWDEKAIRERFPDAATLTAIDPTTKGRTYLDTYGEDWLRMSVADRQQKIRDDQYEIDEAQRAEQEKLEREEAEFERKLRVAGTLNAALDVVYAMLSSTGLKIERRANRSGSSWYFTIENEETGDVVTLRVSDHGPKVEYDRRGNPIVVGGFDEGSGSRYDAADVYIVVGEEMPTNIEDQVRKAVELAGGEMPQKATGPAEGRAGASVSEPGGTASDRSDAGTVPPESTGGNQTAFSRSPSTPAQTAAAAAIREGKTSYAAITARVRRAIKAQDPAGKVSPKAIVEARREALRIVREAGKDGANLETALAASQERARVKATPKGGESVKATVQRTTGVAPADPEARRNLTANLRAQQRAASEAFRAGQQAERERAEAPPRETLAQRIARVTGTKDTSPAVVTTQAKALSVALRREARAANLAAREARKLALDEMSRRLDEMRGKEQDRAKARRRAITIVKKLSPPANVKRYLSAIANARGEKSADALITRVLADLAVFRYREAKAEALAALKKAKPKKMREELRGDVEQARKTLAKIEAERAAALEQVARIRERAAKTDARARYVEKVNARLTDKLNRLRGQVVTEVVAKVEGARAAQRHWDEVLVGERRMTRETVAADFMARVEKLPDLKDDADVPHEGKAGLFARVWQRMYSRDTLAALLGDGLLGRMLVADVRAGESRYMRRYERGIDARRVAMEAEGVAWGSIEARNMSAQADPKRAKLIELKVGGKDLKLTEGEWGELYAVATDNDARGKILDKAPIIIERLGASMTQPVKLTRADLDMIQRTPKLARIRNIVDRLKFDYDRNVTPDERAAFREHFGYDMPQWGGYWTTRRQNDVAAANDAQQVKTTGLIGDYSGSGPKSLATTAMWKERVDTAGPSPYVIGDVFTTHDRMIRESAARIELNRTVRGLNAVIRDPGVRNTLVRKFGRQAYKQLALSVEHSAIILRPEGRAQGIIRPLQVLQRNVSRAFLSVSPSAVLKNVGGVAKLVAVMDPKYLVPALKSIGDSAAFGKVYNRMVAGSPFLRDRHDQGAAVRAAAVLGETSDVVGPLSVKDAAKRGQVGELTDRLPFFAWGDSRASVIAWRAAELQVDAEQPGLKGEARTARIAEIAEAAIRATQNAHTVIDTDYLRSKYRGTIAAPLFMFTSDGITSLNLMEAARIRHGVRSREFARAAAGVMMNNAWAAGVTVGLTTVLPFLVAAAAGRADEEEYRKNRKTFAEVFSRELLANTMGLVYGGGLAMEFGESVFDALAGRQLRSGDMALSPLSRVTADLIDSTTRSIGAVAALYSAETDDAATKARERLTKGVRRMIETGTPLMGLPIVPPLAIARRSIAAATGDVDPAKVHDDVARMIQKPDPDIDRAARALSLTLRGVPREELADARDKAVDAIVRRGPDGRLSADARTQAWRALPETERSARAEAWRQHRKRAAAVVTRAIELARQP